MKTRSTTILKAKKGVQFHLDEWFALMQGNADLFHQKLEGIHGVDDNSDTCTPLKDFEVIVIIKTKDGN